MNKETASLIQQWQTIGNRYAEAYKNGLMQLARSLHFKMLEYARRLHELGVPLGLPPSEARYVQESLKSIMSNPMSAMSRAVIYEIPEILSRNLAREQKRFTMQNFEIIQINEDGTTQFLDPPPEEPKSDIPNPLPRRNCDIEREQRGEKKQC